MRIHLDKLRLSAADLAHYLGCKHLTFLNLQAACGNLSPPIFQDPLQEALQQRSEEHESEYINHLRTYGHAMTQLTDANLGATLEAMRSGVEIITQAQLANGPWVGRADVLRKVPRPSQLGNWSYEVIETKLARQTRATTLLQLCFYSSLLDTIQGGLPEFMYVVTPGSNLKPEPFRVLDYLAYYRRVQSRLARAVSTQALQAAATYPDPVPQCETCRYWSSCDQKRRADDHLSLVAGLSNRQRRELATWNISTLTQLAQLPLPFEHTPSRGSINSFVRVREQARVQLEARQSEQPVYELLPREANRGLARLPPPSPGDIFFDIEGDPFFESGGLEYLLGWVFFENDEPQYQAQWAVNRAEEHRAFEAFIDEVMARWAQYPDLHIYHFAPYEPSAIKRLVGRYATREDEVDRLLRAGIFVDLYLVTKQALRAGIERYSIKDLEQFYDYSRVVELREAAKNLKAFERALELGQVDTVPDTIKTSVETYNRDDCFSTYQLRDWLEVLRTHLSAQGEELTRPQKKDDAPTDEVKDRQQATQDLMDRLLKDLPLEPTKRTKEQHATWLLTHMLGWHRREEKAAWWEYFRLAELSHVELVDEDLALSGLTHLETIGGTKRCPIDRYRFEAQETKIGPGDKLYLSGGASLGTIHHIDPQTQYIDIKKRTDTAQIHPTAVFSSSVVTAGEQAKALFRLGEWVANRGIDAPGAYRASRDLLLALPPRLRSPAVSRHELSLQHPQETLVIAAQRLVGELNHGVLALQGPPGAGKTYTGARMICELVKQGKKVGITAMSHKVIRNLLDGVMSAAQEGALEIKCIQKVRSKPSTHSDSLILQSTNNADVREALRQDQVSVAAGTAWLWAREDMFETIDVLFIDEAGQMSLANVLAVSQAAKNIVLLGDPQQLEQPMRGCHPDGTEVSALQHMLGDHTTIPAHKGLFLEETWRLAPSICTFTSELFYDTRLHPQPDLERQALESPGPLSGAGLWYAAVDHEGNQSSSLEEVKTTESIYRHLLRGDYAWTDSRGHQHPLTHDDILIVTPYNAQVGAIRLQCPEAKVGTVDKFQGQEAPVVIYSMTTSSPEDAPRGLDFLLSLNRLNVATSRARCACILVASPRLFEPECKTPKQVQLANAFCRYMELAKPLQIDERGEIQAVPKTPYNPSLELDFNLLAYLDNPHHSESPTPKPVIVPPINRTHSSPSFDDIFLGLDDTLHALAEALYASELPTPEVGYSVMHNARIIGEVEIGWEAEQVAVLTEDQSSLGPKLEDIGWTVFSGAVTFDTLKTALQKKP